jgi:hypothetical protein
MAANSASRNSAKLSKLILVPEPQIGPGEAVAADHVSDFSRKLAARTASSAACRSAA